jgi:nicotinamidase-related amidase
VLGRGEVACWHKTDVPIHFQQCPLVAQSGHYATEFQCLLLGVKRTLIGDAAMSAFILAGARAKGVYVIYSLFPSPSPATFPDPKISDYVPELAPKGDEPVVTSFVDKFILRDKDTGLQKMLKDKGITNIVPVGVTSHNGVLFTSVSAALRGFNVVVPVDGMAGNNAYEDQVAAYTLTSSIVYKVPLTSIDMIKFQ